jgi:hypothetical protein
VVERLHDSHRFLKLNFGLIGGIWFNWRPDRPLGGKWRLSIGKVGEWYVENRHLQGCSPHLCRLRTDRLAPTTKYWTYWSHVRGMGSVSLVASHQQKVGFAPTASLVGSGEKLGTDPWIGQSSCCGLCWEPFFFSGAVTLLNSVDDYTKGCYALTTWDMYGLGPYAEWAWDACGVLVKFPL